MNCEDQRLDELQYFICWTRQTDRPSSSPTEPSVVIVYSCIQFTVIQSLRLLQV